MSEVSTRVPVVIVGAGPTGAVAAIELGMRGIECLVVDRWAEVYPQPRAVHLDDEVCRTLHSIGVGPEFARVSRPGGGLRLVDRDLRVLAEFRREGVSPANGHPRASMFDQPDLERLLRDRLLELDTVTFRGGQEVTRIEQVAPGRVLVHCRDVVQQEETVIEAEVVLGCDGANSLVRRSIGASLEDLGFEQRWLVIDIETMVDLHQWEGVHQVCDSRRAATYMRIGATRHRWEIRLLDGERVSDFDSLERLEPLLRPWLGRTPLDELTLMRSAEYTFRAALADTWRQGRIFLLGDAAHLTPPFIGQGMGAGVRDAVNLGWKVAGFLSGVLPSDVLDSYEPERRRHARAMIRLAQAVGQVMTQGGRTGDTARRALLPGLNRLASVAHQVTDSTTPALRDSPWITARRGDRLAGHLCPNPPLSGEQRLDDVVGPRWALVTSVAPSPSDRSALLARDCAVVEAVGDLLGWLRAGRATAALVRPDRTVLASGTDVTALITTAALLAPRPMEKAR